MRISPVVILVGVLVVGCSTARPEASPNAGTLYLINGRELAPGYSLRELDPKKIQSVEHFVGVPARLRGAAPGGDVVVITTTDSLTAARITKPMK